MAFLYQSSNYNQPRIEVIRPLYPIAVLTDYRIWEVTATVLREYYEEAQLDSLPPPDLPGVSGRLLLQDDPEQIDGDLYRYTRTYGLPPPQWSQFESYIYTTPSIQGSPGVSAGRRSITKKVSSRVLHEYQRVTGDAIAGGNKQPLNGVATLPLQPTAVFKIVIPAANNAETNQLVQGGSFPTDPDRDTYLTTIAGTEIVVESDVRLWMGNIYERVTRTVEAI